jgi:hypothetical protein
MSLLIALLVLVIPPLRSRADLIYFRGGGGAQVPAATDGERIILKLPDGDAAFNRDDFRAIVPGLDPAVEWPRRREAARGGGTTARYAAAWWALENGLIDEAAAEFRALNRDDPRHAPTSRIVAALDRLKPAARDPEDLGEFERALGVAMTRATGPHVVFLHQHGEAEARERIELLERIVIAYYMVLAGQGIELHAPPRRLVSAWFADRADYLAFLHSQDADAFRTTRGYFHPTWNAVVAYDDRSGNRQRTARQALVDRREALLRAARATDRSEAAIRLAEVQLDLNRRAIDLGTATHEMIHQLVANSGLLPRHDSFPIWMHEGFAAQFEVIRGGRWAGISQAHDLRLRDWRKIHPRPKLEPLIRDAGYGRGYQRDLYAQAWALIYFLRLRHPDRFLTFVDLLRSPRRDDAEAGPPLSAGEHAATAFRRAFGNDLEALEREWHDFLDSAQTPLERHDPSRTRPEAPADSNR